MCMVPNQTVDLWGLNYTEKCKSTRFSNTVAFKLKVAYNLIIIMPMSSHKIWKPLYTLAAHWGRYFWPHSGREKGDGKETHTVFTVRLKLQIGRIKRRKKKTIS